MSSAQIQARQAPISSGAEAANDPTRQAALEQFGQRSASGSPLDTIFQQFGQIEAQQILQIMLDDIGAGINPRQMASNMRGVLDDASYGRAATIARTETMSAWNDAALSNYQANSDIIGSWMWVCMPGAGTCVSCLEEDGTIYSLDEELDDHPNGRCVKGPVTNDYGDILSQYGIDAGEEDFGPGPWDDRISGEEWLLEQDAETQRAAFGSNAAYNAWKVGDAKLADFVKIRHDPVWGDSIQQQSLKGMGLKASDYGVGTAKAAEAAQKAVEEAKATITAAQEVTTLGSARELKADEKQLLRALKTTSGFTDHVVTSEAIGARLAGNADFQRFANEVWNLKDVAQFDQNYRGFLQAYDGLSSEDRAAGLLATRWEVGLSNPLGLAMQQAIQEEFGLPADLLHVPPAWERGLERYQPYMPGLRAWARAQYDETQAYLASKGIDDLTLWRGLAWKSNPPDGFIFDNEVHSAAMDLRPAQAFSAKAETALNFTDSDAQTTYRLLTSTEVQAKDVFSVGATGLGNASEHEVIILGGERPVAYLGVEMAHGAESEAWYKTTSASLFDRFADQPLAGKEEGFAVRASGEGLALPSEASVRDAFAQRAIEGIGDNPRITYRATIDGQDYFVKKLPYMSSEARERGGVAMLQHLGDEYVLPTTYGTLADETPYMMQPWTSGKTLESVKDAADVLQALPVEDRTRLTVVDYLLGQGDKGLANYLVLPDGSVRLTDFEFLGDAHSPRLDLNAPLVRDAYGGMPLSVIPIPRDLLDAIQAQRDVLLADAQSARLTYEGSQGFQQRLDILDRLAALDHPALGDLQRLGDEAVLGVTRATAAPPGDMSWLPPTTERTPKPGLRGFAPQGHFDPYQAKADFGKDFDQLLAAQTQASLNQGVRAVQYYNPGEVPAGRTNADKIAFIKRFVSPEEGFAVRAGGEGFGGEAADSALRAQIERLDPQASVQTAAAWLNQQLPGAQHVIFSALSDDASARVIANGVANLADALPRVSRNLWRVESSDAVQTLVHPQEAWAFATADGRSLLLNPTAWNDLERMATIIPQQADVGWWVAQTPEQLIGHEVGHLVQINYHISDAEWETAMRQAEAAGGVAFVSSYAEASTPESFAEVFTLLIYGDPTDEQLPIVREMAAILDAHGIDYNAVRASVGSATLDLAG